MKNNIMKASFVLLTLTLLLCFACKTKTETQTPSEEDTVLVQLSETATPEALVVQFKSVDLQQLKLISKTMRIYLFTFNSQKVALEALIDQLKESELVDEAQTNKTVSNRN